jgi:hypothetical protein
METLSGWVGWVLFASLIVFCAGVLNLIQGFVALFKDDLYATTKSGLAIQVDYSAWGWTLIVIGALLALTGYGMLAGQIWARVVGVILASLNLLLNFAFIAAYPMWGVIALTLNVIIIYAIAVHGGEARAIRG